MTDLRSGLCHGPACPHHITPASMSEDFCSQACQARWQAALVGVAPDGGLTAPPTESFATYTPLALRPAVPPGAREFLRHDECPAQGDWPGGTRYGLTREEGVYLRNWTAEERALAERWRITLPEMMRRVHLFWWDLPRQTMVEYEPTEIWWTPDALSPVAEAPRMTIRTARRYGESRWLDDPLDEVRLREEMGQSPPLLKIEVGEAAAQPPSNYGGMLADLEEGICIECGRLRYEHQGGTCPNQRSWVRRLWKWVWFRG